MAQPSLGRVASRLLDRVVAVAREQQPRTYRSVLDNFDSSEEAIDAAIAAIQQALSHSGQGLEWTNALAGTLRDLGTSDAVGMGNILRKHHWMGTQFSTPPTLQTLLTDLLKVKQDLRSGEHAHSLPRHASSMENLSEKETLNPLELEEISIKQAVRQNLECDLADIQEYYVNPQETYKFEKGEMIDCDDAGIVQIDNDAKGIKAKDKIINVNKQKFTKQRLKDAENKGSDYYLTVWHAPVYDASKWVFLRSTNTDGSTYTDQAGASFKDQLQLQSRVFGSLPNSQRYIRLGAFKNSNDEQEKIVYVNSRPGAFMHADRLVRVQRRYYLVSDNIDLVSDKKSRDPFGTSFQPGTVIAATVRSSHIRVHASKSKRRGAVWTSVERTFELDDLILKKLDKLCTRLLNEDCPINFSFQAADNVMVYQLPVDLYGKLGRTFLPEGMTENLKQTKKTPKGFYLWLKDGSIKVRPSDWQVLWKQIKQRLCCKRSEPYPEYEILEKAYAFKPGKMGIDYDEEGVVQKVEKKSPADDKGITPGVKIVKVTLDGAAEQTYSKDALSNAEETGISGYTVTVHESYDLYVKIDSQKEFINTTVFFLFGACVKIFSEFNSIGVMFSAEYDNFAAFAFLSQGLLNMLSSGITSCRLAASLANTIVLKDELQLDVLDTKENRSWTETKGIYILKLAFLIYLRAPQLWVQTLMNVHPRAMAQGRFAGKFNKVRIFGTTWLNYGHFCSENNSFYLPTIPGQLLTETVTLVLAGAILRHQKSRFIRFAYMFKFLLYVLRLFRYWRWIREKQFFHEQAVAAWKALTNKEGEPTPPVPLIKFDKSWSDSKTNLVRMLQKNFDRAPLVPPIERNCCRLRPPGNKPAGRNLEAWKVWHDLWSNEVQAFTGDWYAKWLVRIMGGLQISLLVGQLWFYLTSETNQAHESFTKLGDGSCTKAGSYYGNLISNDDSSHADCMSRCAASSSCVAFTDSFPSGPVKGYCKLHNSYPDSVSHDEIFQCWQLKVSEKLGKAFSSETDDRGRGSSPVVVPATSVLMAPAESDALVSAVPRKAFGKGLKLTILQLLNDAIDMEGISLMHEMGVDNVQHLFDEGNEDLMGDVIARLPIAKLIKKEAMQRKESIAV